MSEDNTLKSKETSRPNAKEVSVWVKFISVPGLILNTVVSTLILVGLDNGWTIPGNFYDTINNARATTQIVVQIIASGLGAIHVNAIIQVFNFGSRLILTRRPTSLDRLALWNLLNTKSIDWSPVVIICYVVALAPQPLWVGALTPVQTFMNRTEPSISIQIPRYTMNSHNLWSQNDFYNESAPSVNRKGTFSYLPIQDRLGYLITDGSTASSVDGRPQTRPKNDNSNHTYIGRSYGVGSSVGLTDDAIQESDRMMGYTYTETGYQTTVECIYNSSSQWGLMLVQNGSIAKYWETPFSYLATGPGPNTTVDPSCVNGPSDCPGIIVAGLGGSQEIVAAGWWASAESGLADLGLPKPSNFVGKTRPVLSKAFMALTAGSKYQILNNIQCSISMIPMSFSIDVDVDGRTISVSPQNKTDVPDIEPSGFVASSASAVLGIMSDTDPTLHNPIVGTILQRNIENINQQESLTISTPETILRGVAESLEVLIDDCLIATASAQLMVANDSYTISPIVSFEESSIGKREYAIAIVAINCFILLVFVEEGVRTRIWSALPTFNYSNVKNVIIASSNLEGNLFGHATGAEKVMLKSEDRMMKLVPVGLPDHSSVEVSTEPNIPN
jgi:hypothetical protein